MEVMGSGVLSELESLKIDPKFVYLEREWSHQLSGHVSVVMSYLTSNLWDPGSDPTEHMIVTSSILFKDARPCML